MKGRARAASVIWAEEHPEEVEKQKKKMTRERGYHQKAISILFDELDEEEQAIWQAKADDEKAAIENDPDSCFQCALRRFYLHRIALTVNNLGIKRASPIFLRCSSTNSLDTVQNKLAQL